MAEQHLRQVRLRSGAEGLTAKLLRTPEDVRSKFRGSLNRIVNEGAAGLICLIL